MNVLDAVDVASLRLDIPTFRVGDALKVHVRVIEGSKSRIQIFQGIVIRRQRIGARETFTIGKVSYGVGVERTFRRGLKYPYVAQGFRPSRVSNTRACGTSGFADHQEFLCSIFLYSFGINGEHSPNKRSGRS